jgi:hypothetical protein
LLTSSHLKEEEEEILCKTLTLKKEPGTVTILAHDMHRNYRKKTIQLIFTRL